MTSWTTYDAGKFCLIILFVYLQKSGEEAATENELE